MPKRSNIQQYLEPGFLTSELLLRNLVFILFLGFLAIIYIANSHLAERNVRKVQELQRELKEMRWYYYTLQAENMYNSRRSEMARRTAPLGLKPSSGRPKKLVIPKEED